MYSINSYHPSHLFHLNSRNSLFKFFSQKIYREITLLVVTDSISLCSIFKKFSSYFFSYFLLMNGILFPRKHFFLGGCKYIKGIHTSRNLLMPLLLLLKSPNDNLVLNSSLQNSIQFLK